MLVIPPRWYRRIRSACKLLGLSALLACPQAWYPTPAAAQQKDAREAGVDGDLELRVQRLVQQLNTGDAAARDAVERQLVEMGTSVLPLLPAVAAELPPDVVARLERVRESLRSRLAEQVGSASQLSLRGNLPLARLLEEVHSQTGNRLLDYRQQLGGDAPPIEIPVDAVRREFWPAMDAILDEADLAWYATSGQPHALALQAAAPGQVARGAEACYRGAFRLALTEVLARKSTRVPQDAGLVVRLELMWEPKLAPILVRHSLADLSAEDDSGGTLAACDPAGAIEVPVQPNVSGTVLTLHLPLPARDARALARVKGRLLVVTPGPDEVFEFDRLASVGAAPRTAKRPSGMEVSLEEVRRAGETVTCRVRLRLPASSPPLESHLDWTRRQVAYLIAPDGSRVEDPVVERYQEGEHEVGYAYLFPIAGDLAGHRLVVRSPGALVEVPVAYEFTGVELP